MVCGASARHVLGAGRLAAGAGAAAGRVLAGDVRSTEVLPLASMHTMFVRLHNRVALELRRLNTHWDSDQVYQESRMIVAAIHQKINYLEYLPLILGSSGVSASVFTFL